MSVNMGLRSRELKPERQKTPKLKHKKHSSFRTALPLIGLLALGSAAPAAALFSKPVAAQSSNDKIWVADSIGGIVISKKLLGEGDVCNIGGAELKIIKIEESEIEVNIKRKCYPATTLCDTVITRKRIYSRDHDGMLLFSKDGLLRREVSMCLPSIEDTSKYYCSNPKERKATLIGLGIALAIALAVVAFIRSYIIHRINAPPPRPGRMEYFSSFGRDNPGGYAYIPASPEKEEKHYAEFQNWRCVQLLKKCKKLLNKLPADKVSEEELEWLKHRLIKTFPYLSGYESDLEKEALLHGKLVIYSYSFVYGEQPDNPDNLKSYYEGRQGTIIGDPGKYMLVAEIKGRVVEIIQNRKSRKAKKA